MFEVKTPILLTSIEYTKKAVDGVLTGALEPKQASVVVSGARALQSAVNTDIKARLSEPKLRRIEESAA